jgi:hypothetical protein
LPGWTESWRPDPTWATVPRVSSENFALLFAMVEHRAWVLAIEAYLRGERQVPPPLDVGRCRFGEWLDGEGLACLGAQPALAEIEGLHRRAHALGTELCGLHARGHASEALARLDEIHALRDNLLGQLNSHLQRHPS